MKKLLKSIFGRLSIIALFIILQFAFFIFLIFRLKEYFAVISVVFDILAAIIVFFIIDRKIPNESKISWIILILIAPIFGTIAYLMFSKNRLSKRQSRVIKKIKKESLEISEEQSENNEIIKESLPDDLKMQLEYINSVSNNVAYKNSEVTFYPYGERFFPDYLEELKKAKEFIFIEYFIIDNGVVLDSVLDILYQKVKEGVEVRFIYDDFGSINTVPSSFAKQLRKKGIKAYKFNRFVPVVSSIHNNRDHRKITVIDGKVGFTGGLNLADEYVNLKHPYGVWKDSAIRIKGDGVDGLTSMFLSIYCMQKREVEDYEPYLKKNHEIVNDNVVIPYGDGPRPYYDEYISENVYINMINSAKRYIYITTPYLICDNKLKSALKLAAMRGVDVRIVLPHIPDKKIVFLISRSNYRQLIDAGVKIYEFKDGFIHSKQLICDDVSAIVGTINFDYRSLLHHFEDAVLMFNQDVIEDIKKDFDHIFENSISMQNYKQRKITRILCVILEVFQPLL